MTEWRNKSSYVEAVQAMAKTGCRTFGIDINELTLEYPIQALLRERVPGAQFTHTGVRNESRRYRQPAGPPCAVLCLDCAGVGERAQTYSDCGKPRQIGRFLLYLPALTN